MPEEVRLWRIHEGDTNQRDTLEEIPGSALNLEARLEGWLEHDISVLSPGLLVIGRQIETAFGGLIDLLCLDHAGDVVVVELKRDKTPREITAQILDYGSWVKDLSNEQITSIGESRFGQGKLEEEFKRTFGADLPETLNEDHRLLIVASQIDPSSERIIRYLSDTYGVNINAATFQYFKEPNGAELVARVFLIEPAQVDLQSRVKGQSKRRPNLTYEELDAIAEEKRVQELYRQAITKLERYFRKHTTRSSIGFKGMVNGSRKTVVSLIPRDSSANDGLRFQVYISCLCEMLKISEEEILAILPSRRERGIPWEGAGEVFQGFFATQDEVDRFASGVARLELNAAT